MSGVVGEGGLEVRRVEVEGHDIQSGAAVQLSCRLGDGQAGGDGAPTKDAPTALPASSMIPPLFAALRVGEPEICEDTDQDTELPPTVPDRPTPRTRDQGS
ncbi:MAG: hypothetical protein JO272_13555 [Pseudonocardiales bacterium]|nr:hypothetical protein [Pseudonocardiales bacterium]